MKVVFEDMNMATYASFYDVMQVSFGYHEVGGRVCKGYWVIFNDIHKQDKFMKSSRYQLNRVEECLFL